MNLRTIDCHIIKNTCVVKQRMTEMFIFRDDEFDSSQTEQLISSGIGFFPNRDPFVYDVIVEKTDVDVFCSYVVVTHFNHEMRRDENGFNDIVRRMWWQVKVHDDHEIMAAYQAIFPDVFPDGQVYDRVGEISDEKVFNTQCVSGNPLSFLNATLLPRSLDFPTLNIENAIPMSNIPSSLYRVVETPEELMTFVSP